MSTGHRPGTTFRLAFTAAVQPRWEALDRRARAALESRLLEVARTVGLRHWLSPDEEQEEFSLQVDMYVVSYRLDVPRRALRVDRLELVTPAPGRTRTSRKPPR